jgi:hypothetical protein
MEFPAKMLWTHATGFATLSPLINCLWAVVIEIFSFLTQPLISINLRLGDIETQGIRTVKRIHLHVLPLVIFSILMSSPNASAEETFFSKLNPFQKKEATAVKVNISDTSKSSWTFPRWKPMKMPWSGPSFSFTPTWISDIKPPSFSSTWTRMSNGTKEAYGKSKTFFMPWTKTAVRQPAVMRPPTGSRGVYRAVPKGKPAKKSFFGSFLNSKDDEPRPSRTVGEFLSQERPKP